MVLTVQGCILWSMDKHLFKSGTKCRLPLRSGLFENGRIVPLANCGRLKRLC
jgi:hypothetical protein